MLKRTVAQKMGIKQDARTWMVNAPDTTLNDMALPYLELAKQLRGEFDYIHLFVKTEEEMRKQFQKLKEHLAISGMLWLSWPKGKPEGVDLTLKDVIRIGYEYGLVESTCLSVDNIWSGLKFTHPKPGEEYKNSYGKLKQKP